MNTFSQPVCQIGQAIGTIIRTNLPFQFYHCSTNFSFVIKLDKGLGAILGPYMAPYLMNFRKYLIKSRYVLFYRRHHTFDVKTCFQQNLYVFDIIDIVTS